MAYRNTPQASTTKAPAELMWVRRIITVWNHIRQICEGQPTKIVKIKKRGMIKVRDHETLRKSKRYGGAVNEINVRVQNCVNDERDYGGYHAKGRKWLGTSGRGERGARRTNVRNICSPARYDIIFEKESKDATIAKQHSLNKPTGQRHIMDTGKWCGKWRIMS
ncbi:hypothetical protein GJ496_011705 [Pomphorhynchus laevis]|nr:hypothetical protein GJ496_011705 [Pomphorhynchus laevis]